MNDQNKDEIKKERYKRDPVYTKQHYGSPKTEPTKKRVQFAKEILMLIGIIVACAAYFIYPAIRPKQAGNIEIETNEWYVSGAYDLCEEHLKEQLRDPRSYERAGEIKVIQDNGIAWEFRSRNGFGGMNAAQGICLIKKEKKWVAATIK